MKFLKIMFGLSCFILRVNIISSISWERIRCSSDPEQTNADGVADIGRFPWLGVVQHSFMIGGKMRFAITTGLLIHPAYAIAPAEDIAKILRTQLRNSTKFIMWHSDSVKYALDLRDYILHPEYTEGRTLATIALIELITYGETGIGDNPKPVLPICIPVKGAGSYADIYAAKMTDENKELQKELFKMNFVDSKDCEEFYYTAKLDSKKMAPAFPTCAMVDKPMSPCVWDAGAALITRQSWGYWALLGFSVRGPGCGAPTRFLNLYDYLPWINDVITPQPIDMDIDMHRIGVRQLSPMEIVLYEADKLMAFGVGQCEPSQRGTILYKDSFEVTMSKNAGQGFFFVAVSQIASFTCASVHVEEATAKSNTAVWIEHYCHREAMGMSHGNKRPTDFLKKNQCFIYFKSAAFVEFRFRFSFKASISISLFGIGETMAMIPNPYIKSETTESWWPTDTKIKWSSFYPYYLSKWYL